MRFQIVICVICSICGYCPLPARAQDGEAHPIQITAYLENDSRWLKPNHDTDRYYTHGSALVLGHQPDWADAIARFIPFEASAGQPRTAAGYFAGQLIFTPGDIRVEELLEDDRPYAGYLYGGAFWQRATEVEADKPAVLDHLQLELGIVGPSSLAEDAQKAVHDMVDDVEPQGWRHQLHDEPTFQFYGRRKWRLPLAAFEMFNAPWQLQAIPQAGAALGTVYRYLHGDVTLRLGVNLPDDFGPGRLADFAAATALDQPAPNGWSIYGYARLGGRVVEHNMFIEGNNFRDSLGVDEEPLVGVVQGGGVLQYRCDACAVQLVYSQTFQTEEFEDQNGSHAFGALMLSVVFGF